MDILSTIVQHKLIEVEQAKARLPFNKLYAATEAVTRTPISMKQALKNSPTGIIAEFKRRSPSKQWINQPAKPEDVVPGYAENGASALSILTDEQFFGGSLEYISRVRNMVDIPILRKDFIIDEYQLFQARVIGADAVLLIAAELTPEQCARLAKTAHELQLETLLEIHSESELEYVGDNIDMVGVNNRNLGSFVVDVNNSVRLAEALPKDYVLVSESGISSPETIRSLRQIGYRGFLIGETFMRESSPADALASFISSI